MRGIPVSRPDVNRRGTLVKGGRSPARAATPSNAQDEVPRMSFRSIRSGPLASNFQSIRWMSFGANWIGRVEYLHYDFGKVRNTTTTVTNLPGTIAVSEHRGRQTVDIVRANLL